jgi:hypothetical protein
MLLLLHYQVHLHAILASTATLLAILGCPPITLLWTKPSAHVIIGFILIGLVMVEFGMGKYLHLQCLRSKFITTHVTVVPHWVSAPVVLVCFCLHTYGTLSIYTVHMSILTPYTQVLHG